MITIMIIMIILVTNTNHNRIIDDIGAVSGMNINKLLFYDITTFADLICILFI